MQPSCQFTRSPVIPTYEYKCQECGHSWEKDQKITEDPLRTCPSCTKETAQRLIGKPNFILQGGGWYQDGYAKKY